MRRIKRINGVIPAIIHTAFSDYKERYTSWEADAYIMKSSDLSGLKNKIKELLDKKSVSPEMQEVRTK